MTSNPEYQVLTSGHGRLLYLESYDWALDQEELGAQLEEFVSQNPNYEFAHKKVHFYFFSGPGEGSVWVGREIIGPPMGDDACELQTYDLEQSKIYSFNFSNELELTHKNFVNFYNSCLQSLKQAGLEVGETWRLELTSYEKNGGALSFSREMQFFETY